MGKIKLRCQIRDLMSAVTCYIIDADTSYDLLLGRLWIHKNHVVPSMLHQVMNYVDAQGQMHTLVVEQHPFRGLKTHFTDSLLYQDANETNAWEVFASESGNEAESLWYVWLSPLCRPLIQLISRTLAVTALA